MHRLVAAAFVAAVAASAEAQAPARPDPTDAKAGPSAPPVHESAFKDYRPYADPKPSRWGNANAEVGKLKGHVGHMRDEPAGEAGSTGKPQKAPGAHGAHK